MRGWPRAVSGDAVLLERLAGNLVENAVRYNAALGWVRVETGVEGGRAILHVANPGDPVDPSTPRELLEPFRRLETSRSRTTGGYGLGLAVVRAVARRTAATSACAPREGGLEVTVALPAGPAAAAEPSSARRRDRRPAALVARPGKPSYSRAL